LIIGLPKRIFRIAYSFSVRHACLGINTFGSLIPTVTSKKDNISLPYFSLKVNRDTGTHPSYVHVPMYGIVSLVGNVKFPALYIK